ncbi:uncharacterized protein LOC129599461 isoform X2 [Paramacrobiotus metropolitanus]|uniref:uncharacterized protein LOC129599461 isoform X2 n=1 Tax=Paramacrobiotus metropolitanus TaxID=2943436 RepID=UPI002445CA6F|nr:uncharacterized protein LOC129599461 isoform X2 [Paramacrobiotus metropolitanus]
MFEHSFLFFVSVLVLAPIAASRRSAVQAPDCFLTINEFQLGAEKFKREFIELSTNCRPLDLSPFVIVMWKGAKDKPARLSHRIRFTLDSNCSALNLMQTSLVIGTQDLEANLSIKTDTLFCPFDLFNVSTEWPKNQHFWIDKGSSSINAIVVYKNVPAEKLQVNISISEETAFRSHIQDVVFLTKDGTGRSLKDFLLPDYDVANANQSNKGYYVLKEQKLPGNLSADTRKSFSFCCKPGQGREERKWPMGFKFGKPSPGEENDCIGEYCFDPKGSTFNLSLFDRCVKASVHEKFPDGKNEFRSCGLLSIYLDSVPSNCAPHLMTVSTEMWPLTEMIVNELLAEDLVISSDIAVNSARSRG